MPQYGELTIPVAEIQKALDATVISENKPDDLVHGFSQADRRQYNVTPI